MRPTLSRRRGVLAAAVVGLGVLGPAAQPASAASVPRAAAPRPQPCPGTTGPAPAPTRTPSPTLSPGVPPARVSPAPTTPGPSQPVATVPPPVIPKRDVVVGGGRLAANGLVTDLPPGVPAPPALNATSWVIADAKSGAIVAAKAPHAPMRPASTIKSLTALVLLPKIAAKQVITATKADVQADGTKVGLVEGNKYPASTLFQAMVMSSANDAVYALTRTYPGGRTKELADENALAHELGALDTVVKDPSGLDVEGQTSSAYDLALIGRQAIATSSYERFATTKLAVFPGAKMAGGRVVKPYQIQNHNKLLYNYPGTIGVKNGYTTLAHSTFVAAVSRGGRTYLLTYMCSDSIGWRQMAASFDWAFANAAKARPVGQLVEKGSVDATPSATPSTPLVAATPEQPSESGTTSAAAAVGGPKVPAVVEKWWGAGLLGLVLLGAGVLGTRRMSAGRRAKQGTHAVR